ncbi:unnamed protein product [Discosporangium mesarthrocarpum]
MLHAALRNLFELQAIIITRKRLRPLLTPLGYHLAHLPMDARVGKLLIIGAILNCLDPILTIAAALSYKAPFQRPFAAQKQADKARQRFAQHKSDHLAIVEAFSAWRNKSRTLSPRGMRQWCLENFLSVQTLRMMSSLREQFLHGLVEAGFVPQRESGQGGRAWRGGDGDGDPDCNSNNIELVQSILCAGLYPHVAAFVRPNARRELKKAHFVTRDDKEPVFIHPSSVNHSRFTQAATSGRQVWVMYHSKVKTRQVYIHDSTYVTPFSLMLWGGRIRHERPNGRKSKVDVVIDNWLRFRTNEKTAVVFKAMRQELSNLLVAKIEDPHGDTGALPGMLVSCLVLLLNVESRCQR